jgi:hypothetical protein
LSRHPPAYNMARSCWKCGGVENTMDELIGRLVNVVGVDRTAAETAIGIILDFLAKEGPADKVQLLVAKLPGAEALQQQAAAAGGSGMGGVMGAGMSMMSAGLSMGQVQDVTREFIAFAREKVGADAVGEIVDAIPGLSQFV